jgi:CRP/FNR family transcriptional regulator, cyclic AMP receptor protein
VAGAPVDVLKGVPLFADLDRRELQQVARLFKARRFPEGDTVMKEGLGGAAFFVIESGEAIVSVGGRERRRLKPGDYFGEIALIDEGPRTATVRAATELACYGLTLWEFRPLVRENGEIGWKLLQALAARFRDVANDAQSAVSHGGSSPPSEGSAPELRAS